MIFLSGNLLKRSANAEQLRCLLDNGDMAQWQDWISALHVDRQLLHVSKDFTRRHSLRIACICVVSETSACFKQPRCSVDVRLQSCLNRLPAVPTAQARDRSKGMHAATAVTLSLSTGGSHCLSSRVASQTESQRCRISAVSMPRVEHCRVRQPKCNITKHDATCRLGTCKASCEPGELPDEPACRLLSGFNLCAILIRPPPEL